MSKTIKASLIILIAIAGFVVVRVLFSISKSLDTASAKDEIAKVDYGDTNDYDHDGLSNADEEYWGTDPFNPDTDGDGYLDGEEVLSKHDPLKTATTEGGDSLDAKSKLVKDNATKGMADLIVSGIAAGDLNSSAQDRKSTRLNSSHRL